MIANTTAGIGERIQALSDPSPFGVANAFATLATEPYALLGSVLTAAECAALIAAYDDDERYRKRVNMGAHRFGRGEYRYFADPLPAVVGDMRERLYAALVPIANLWHERLRDATRFPDDLQTFTARSRAAGQARPTPLILKYGAGDYNRLHRDLYGDVVFPLQATISLSAPERDFTGGEFALVEQHPRAQSMIHVVPLAAGDAVVFAVDRRPVPSARGYSAARTRHGVSTVRSGARYALGIIFHDART